MAGHVDPLPGIQSSHEAPREEEGRDEKEHIDAAGHPAQPHVVRHDEEHGEGAQALDVPTANSARCRHGCSQGAAGVAERAST